MYYFIYKTLQVTSIGGCTIPTIEGINGGQGTYKDWLLGTTTDYTLLLQIKEFQPRLVKESVWRGFPLIGKTQVADSTETPPTMRGLTADELQWQKDATNWELKENLRWLIEIGVGDPLDQLANTDKQVQLLTGIVVRMYRMMEEIVAKLVLQNILTAESVSTILPPEVRMNYTTYCNNYAGAVEQGLYKDRVDIEDPAEMIPKIMEASALIAQLVQSEYLEKRV